MRTPSQPPVSLPGSGRRRLVRSLIVGVCVLYVGVLLLLPLAGIVYTALEPGWSKVVETFSRPDVQHAFFLTGVITVITVVVTTFFGVITAWVLVRQRFVGKSLLERARRPAVRAVAGHGGPRGRDPVRVRRVARAVLRRARDPGDLRGAVDGARDDLHLHPVHDPRGRAGARGDRQGRGGRGAHARGVASCRPGARSLCRTSAGASSTASPSRSRARSGRSAPC